MARELGCSEDEAAFDEKLKAVVGPKASDADAAPGGASSRPKSGS